MLIRGADHPSPSFHSELDHPQMTLHNRARRRSRVKPTSSCWWLGYHDSLSGRRTSCISIYIYFKQKSGRSRIKRSKDCCVQFFLGIKRSKRLLCQFFFGIKRSKDHCVQFFLGIKRDPKVYCVQFFLGDQKIQRLLCPIFADQKIQRFFCVSHFFGGHHFGLSLLAGCRNHWLQRSRSMACCWSCIVAFGRRFVSTDATFSIYHEIFHWTTWAWGFVKFAILNLKDPNPSKNWRPWRFPVPSGSFGMCFFHVLQATVICVTGSEAHLTVGARFQHWWASRSASRNV